MRLRFTIRDLLWLTLLVGLVLGWIADNRRSAHEREQSAREAAKQIQTLKDEAKDSEAQAELWQARLRRKIIGIPLEDEDDLRKALPAPNLDKRAPDRSGDPVPMGLRPKTG